MALKTRPPKRAGRYSRIISCIGLITLLAAVAASTAAAATWSEAGDAGELPATAQAPVGVGSLTALTGVMPSGSAADNDVDMYRICVTAPSLFSALTSGGVIDPQLFLFNANGFGVEARDDIVSGINRESWLTAGNPHSPTSPGVYYLAISRWDREPVSPGGFIFPTELSLAGTINGPTGPGGGLPISGWAGVGDGGFEDGPTDYTITLAGAAYCLNFTGFFAPIENDAVNSAKAGQTIPVKWHLDDAAGNPVSDPTSFVSLISESGAAACAGLPEEAIEEFAGESGLQYLGDGDWQFNWKTPKSYAGQCRTMTLTLSDGSTHTASFSFR